MARKAEILAKAITELLMACIDLQSVLKEAGVELDWDNATMLKEKAQEHLAEALEQYRH